jgi:3-phenylpropionate/cinnamic acid dioxygenase small subunit
MSGPISLDEAIAFVWREADMLDRLDYAAWLGLWTPDGRYVIPIDRDGRDPEGALNIVFDDAAMRAARVKRLASGFSMSAAPPARTVRTISRFVAEPDGDSLILRAAMHLAEYKYQRLRMLAADITYRLRFEQGSIRMEGKSVLLINSDEALHGIGYLL